MSMDEWVGDTIPNEILDDAAMWIARLDSEDADRHDRRAFAAWLDEDPLHAQAYSELTPVWARISTMGDLRDLTDHGNVVSLFGSADKNEQEEVVHIANAPWWQIAAVFAMIFTGLVASMINDAGEAPDMAANNTHKSVDIAEYSAES